MQGICLWIVGIERTVGARKSLGCLEMVKKLAFSTKRPVLADKAVEYTTFLLPTFYVMLCDVMIIRNCQWDVLIRDPCVK